MTTRRIGPPLLRYAFAITVVQAAGVVLFLISEAPALYIGFSILYVIELLIPVWAELAAPTPWHREHIAERYRLFTIIVLGETILAASLAVTFITIDGLTCGVGGGLARRSGDRVRDVVALLLSPGPTSC